MKARRVHTAVWIPEYSGNDCSWRVYRSATVFTKRKRRPA